MASIRILDRVCESSREDCKARATLEVLDDKGAVVGSYCSRHAQSKLVEVTKTERAITTRKPVAGGAR